MMGVAFRVLRKAREKGRKNFALFVISAKYGLISETQEVEPYELKMDKEHALELIPILKEAFISNLIDFEEVYIEAGQLYLKACSEGIKALEGRGIKVYVSNGPIGKRLRALKM